MEGKNVDELIAQTKEVEGPAHLLLKVIKGLLEIAFPDSKLNELSKNGILKVHVPAIDAEQLIMLGSVAKSKADTCKIHLKRSGYGITIMFELKK